MSITTKRNIVNRYCDSISMENCSKECVLYKKWCTNDTNCIDIDTATEEELNEALALIHSDNNKSKDEMRKIFGISPITPDYYNDTKIAPIDVIEDWGLDFCLGSALKYIKRCGKKDNNPSVQDLRKVIWYIERRIKQLESLDV